MDFRDQIRKIGDGVEKKAKEAADSSAKAASRSRIRHLLNRCQDDLQSTYSILGSKFYADHKDNPDDQYTQEFQQIRDLLAEIDTLNTELAELDEATICPACGAKILDSQKFCPECGRENESYGQAQAKAAEEEANQRAIKEAEQAERIARMGNRTAPAQVYESTNKRITPSVSPDTDTSSATSDEAESKNENDMSE